MSFKIYTYLRFLVLTFFNGNKSETSSLLTSYNSINHKQKEKICFHRKSLLSCEKNISVNDFGAKSQIFKTNQRNVSLIAKYAGISKKRSFLLAALSNKKSTILEIGTSIGLATNSIAVGNPNSKIFTLEGCMETQEIAKKFGIHKNNQIQYILGNFKNTLKNVLATNNFDLIYFDGNHTKEATLNYFNQCLSSKTEKAIFIFDDIYWSKEMLEAWNTIRKNKNVSTSIDTYQWGILFFEENLPKKHFYLKI